jgi:hypothetical protein
MRAHEDLNKNPKKSICGRWIDFSLADEFHLRRKIIIHGKRLEKSSTADYILIIWTIIFAGWISSSVVDYHPVQPAIMDDFCPSIVLLGQLPSSEV